jgi:hypothetical protein
MLRVMLREILRLMLRWLLRSMPTSVLREMLRQVPTTFANRGAKRLLTTVRTVLLTLLRTIHGQATTANHPCWAVALRSGRATKGDEANAVETCLQIDTISQRNRCGKNGAKPRRQIATKGGNELAAI